MTARPDRDRDRDRGGSDADVCLLADAIYATYGYDLRGYAPASLRRRAEATLARTGLRSLHELRERIVARPDLFPALLDDLTVHVSDMFRDPGFYRAVRTRVVPLLRTYPLLNIWIAGCASGEEAYSMAILLHEEQVYERCQIYATDVSPRAIEAAKRGQYGAQRLGSFADNHRHAGARADLSAYYTAAYDGIAFKESLRRKILFFQHDLVSDHSFAEMHLILCRNVLIYFGPALREQVLGKLSRSLRPGGFLCLGTSERLRLPVSDGYAEVETGQRIYRLRGEGGPLSRPGAEA